MQGRLPACWRAAVRLRKDSVRLASDFLETMPPRPSFGSRIPLLPESGVGKGREVRRRFRIVVSGACALLAAALCLAYGQQVREEARRERTAALERYGGEVVTLVVAARGIEAGETVDRTNVSEREWLVDLAPAEALTSLDEAMGAEVSVPVAEGVPLTALNFRDDAKSVEVPADRVALTVPIEDDLGVPPGTGAGDELAAYEVSDGSVRLLVSELRVLSAPQAGTGALSGGSLTVAVAPDDVPPVLAASEEGSLRLALPGSAAIAEQQVAPTQVPAEEAPQGAQAGDGAGPGDVPAETGEGDDAA